MSRDYHSPFNNNMEDESKLFMKYD